MLDQFGTISVRECRISKAEVEKIISENLKLRGPDSYEFDYAHPILIWGIDGSLIVRWPSIEMREEPGRTPKGLQLMPWPEFVERKAQELARERDRVRAEQEKAVAARRAAEVKDTHENEGKSA